MKRRASIPAVLLAVFLLTAARGPGASASYTVYGCENWASYNWTPANLATYLQCPGFAVRNVGGSFSSPFGAEAGWSFGAPAGTSIAAVTLTGEFRGLAGWQTAAWSEGGGVPSGGYIHEQCPGVWCSGDVDYLGTYPVSNAAAFRIRVRCVAATCSNGDLYGVANLNAVAVTLNDFTAPNLEIAGGALASGNWQAGTQSVAVRATDNTGIQALRAYVDGSVRSEQPRPGCNWGATLPCSNSGGDIAVATNGLSDGTHRLTIEAIDTGGLSTTRNTTIYVDNVAPAQPASAQIQDGDAWRAANQFAIRWTDPNQSAAPITAAVYRLCPSGSADASKCVSGSERRTPGTAATKLAVPAPGDWSLRLWLRDAAGNESASNATVVDHLRFDPTPPTAVIAPPNPADPTRIQVLATDDVSGIAGGEVEAQLSGENVWRPLPTQVVAGGLAATLDDSQLPDGAYRLRARVVDAAGNERSTQAFDGGAAAALTLPLRIKTRLAVGKVKHVRASTSRGKRPRYRRIIVNKPRASYGRTIRLSGRLTTPGANPVANVPVDVYEQVQLPGAAWTQIATVPTSRTGRFTFKALRGPSRLVQFRYGGTATVRPRTSTVELLIRGSSSFDVDRHRVVNGDDVIFRGHVRGRPLPPQGKLVELQVYTRRRWRTFAQPRANATTGRWSYRYKFESVRGHERFRFRARVRKEAGYPYELGTSRGVNVFVRGV